MGCTSFDKPLSSFERVFEIYIDTTSWGHCSFDSWIRSVDAYAGNDLLYLNSKGVIPANAVIRRGERRNNPFREKRKFDATTFAERTTGDSNQSLLSDEEEQEEQEEKLDKKVLADMEG